MPRDPNIHTVNVKDPDGDVWKAEQTIGIGVEGMGQPLSSHVRFTNTRTGELLSGHALRIEPANVEELAAALREAKRRKAMDR